MCAPGSETFSLSRLSSMIKVRDDFKCQVLQFLPYRESKKKGPAFEELVLPGYISSVVMLYLVE